MDNKSVELEGEVEDKSENDQWAIKLNFDKKFGPWIYCGFFPVF